MIAAPRVFPIRFDGISRPMALIGFTRAGSRVVLEERDLDVRMGWGFALRVPRAAVRTAAPDHRPLLDRGVHGWFGRWNVAASSRGLVRIEFASPVAARVGPVPVRVRTLRVSLEEPEAFLLALEAPAAAPPDAG
ncbi:MAG: hypothetical protein ACKOKE_06760 [Actinomycetota bacterium]